MTRQAGRQGVGSEEKTETNIEIGGTPSLLGTAAVLRSKEPKGASLRTHTSTGSKDPQEGPTLVPSRSPQSHIPVSLTSWGWQLYKGLPAFRGGVPGGLPSGAGMRPNLVPGGQ